MVFDSVNVYFIIGKLRKIVDEQYQFWGCCCAPLVKASNPVIPRPMIIA
jgi:hypothetical protein